jgi:hypothetical protein
MLTVVIHTPPQSPSPSFAARHPTAFPCLHPDDLTKVILILEQINPNALLSSHFRFRVIV